MDIRKALVLGGVMAAALAVPATGASASVGVFAPPVGPSHFGPPRNALVAKTSLTNRPDSGGNGNWAIDTETRTLTITETSHTGSVYNYTATVSDTGTFKTSSGAFTPNQGGTNAGKKIKGTVQGTMTGTANYSFSATSLPSNARNLGVPTSENGTPAPSSPQTTSLWYEQAFPAATSFSGTGIGTWSWTYLSGSSGNGCTQNNGRGNSNGRGNGNGRGNSNGFGFGQGNDGNRGRGNGPGCSCDDSHSRGHGRNNGQGQGCTRDHGNQGGNGRGRGGQGGNNQGGNGRGRGGQGQNQGNGSSRSAEKWVDASNNNDGQNPADGNITGS